MPSPFPGMDPWLEAPGVFPDLHATLITYLGDELNAVLPEPYFARTATRVWIDDERTRDPDVGAYDPRTASPASVGDWGSQMLASGMVALATEPANDPVEERYVEIRSSRDERLVTAIEILSPSNKAAGSPGRAAYREKQMEYALGGANFVEIDLLRGGRHTTFVAEAQLRSAFPASCYHVCVTPAGLPRSCFAIGFGIEQPLPTIRIPLDPAIDPLPIDLQRLLTQCHDRRRYDRQVRYDQPCDPPLSREHTAVVDALLKRNRPTLG